MLTHQGGGKYLHREPKPIAFVTAKWQQCTAIEKVVRVYGGIAGLVED